MQDRRLVGDLLLYPDDDEVSFNELFLLRSTNILADILPDFRNLEEAVRAEEEFDRIFAKKGLPDEIPEPVVSLKGQKSLDSVWIVALVVGAGLAGTNGEARRLIGQGGIRLDGNVVEDVDSTVSIDRPRLVQAGKRRFVRIVPANVSLEA